MEIYAEWYREYRRHRGLGLNIFIRDLAGLINSVVRPSESKMTMTSSTVPGVSLVCSKVADGANRGVEPSPTSRTHANWGGLPVACKSGLARFAFLFWGVSSVVFGWMGSTWDGVAPSWTAGIEKALRNKQ